MNKEIFITNQLKGFIRLNDKFFIDLSQTKEDFTRSKNGKETLSFIYDNDNIITKYNYRYVVRCSCGKEVWMRKDHYNEYRKNKKEFLCSSCQQKGSNNRFWNSKNPINWTAKDKYSEKKKLAYKKQSETKKSFSKEKINEINNKIFTRETRNKINESLKKTIAKMKIENPEKYTKWRNKLKGNVVKSKAHIKVEQQLNDLNILNESEYILDGPRNYRYDIHLINKNILIEINGDRVHANPNKFKADDIIANQWKRFVAKDIWKYDEEKRIYAEKRNYTVITIWSSDIHKNNFTISDYMN